MGGFEEFENQSNDSELCKSTSPRPCARSPEGKLLEAKLDKVDALCKLMQLSQLFSVDEETTAMQHVWDPQRIWAIIVDTKPKFPVNHQSRM